MEKRYRLLTKSNLDGIISAILLKNLNLIEEVSFIHEDDMISGNTDVSLDDITVNLPYTKGAHQAFDYHDSSAKADIVMNENHIFDTSAQSASDVIYTHYHDRLKNNSALESLVQMATNATNHTLTMDERMYVYDQYQTLFNKKPVEA